MDVHACAGVYLSLKDVVYANNSVIQITEIGETNPDNDLNEGLQCITDRMPCCRFTFRAGEWYMYTPERTIVPGPTTMSFYRNRGCDDGTVNLNRPSGVLMPTGLYCCEVPDALNVMQRACATISELETSLNHYWWYCMVSLMSSYHCCSTDQRQWSHSSSRAEPLPHLWNQWS